MHTGFMLTSRLMEYDKHLYWYAVNDRLFTIIKTKPFYCRISTNHYFF